MEQEINIQQLERYEEDLLDKEIEEHLLRAEDDIENGRVRDFVEVWEEWKIKYDL